MRLRAHMRRPRHPPHGHKALTRMGRRATPDTRRHASKATRSGLTCDRKSGRRRPRHPTCHTCLCGVHVGRRRAPGRTTTITSNPLDPEPPTPHGHSDPNEHLHHPPAETHGGTRTRRGHHGPRRPPETPRRPYARRTPHTGASTTRARARNTALQLPIYGHTPRTRRRQEGIRGARRAGHRLHRILPTIRIGTRGGGCRTLPRRHPASGKMARQAIALHVPAAPPRSPSTLTAAPHPRPNNGDGRRRRRDGRGKGIP